MRTRVPLIKLNDFCVCFFFYLFRVSFLRNDLAQWSIYIYNIPTDAPHLGTLLFLLVAPLSRGRLCTARKSLDDFYLLYYTALYNIIIIVHRGRRHRSAATCATVAPEEDEYVKIKKVQKDFAYIHTHAHTGARVCVCVFGVCNFLYFLIFFLLRHTL